MKENGEIDTVGVKDASNGCIGGIVNETVTDASGGDEKGNEKKKSEEENALKAEEEELKHLRHSLIQIVSGMCPNFDGMYTCPLSPHLPALLLPLLQALEDRDVDLSRQAKRSLSYF